jgi:hypothetical protein
MTRTHAAIQLLKHGPLTMLEFVEITGWTYSRCRQTLGYLVDRRCSVIRDHGVYRVAAESNT